MMQHILAEELEKQDIETTTSLEINFNNKINKREFFFKQYRGVPYEVEQPKYNSNYSQKKG